MRPWTRRGRTLVGAAVVAGVALRLAFAVGYWTGKPLTHDEREYLSLATNLAQGRGFAPDLPLEPRPARADTFGRAPLYPALLAPLTWLDADLRGGRLPPAVPLGVKVAQCLIGGLTVLGAAALARRVAGAPAGIVAAWLAAVHPALAWISAYALTEAVYVPLVMATVLTLGRTLDRPGPDTATRPTDGRRMLVGGVLCGVGALTRPATVFLVPVVVCWLLARRQRRLAAIFVAATVLTIAPWTVRNVFEYGRVVFIATEGGVTFWTGNHPLAIGEGDLAANPQMKAANLVLRARHPDLTPAELEPVYYREAFAWIGQEPMAWLALMTRKVFYTVVPLGPSYRLHSPLYYWASVVPYALLLPFACLGLGRAWRSTAPPVALVLFAVSSLVASVVFLPQERFRISVVDPTLLVLASVWIAGKARRTP